MTSECINTTITEDINFFNLSLDDGDKEFHSIIGHIEDILVEDKFLDNHRNFMEKYWTEFSDSDENKFCYTDIFREYSETIEKHIEEELIRKMPEFTMAKFEEELENRKAEMDGEIFELLATFTDFVSFKAMFLDYKAMKEGKSIDFTQDLCVSKYSLEYGKKQ